MSCESCGAPALRIVDDSGATDAGRFTEQYRCERCGATGEIRGDAAAPAREWDRVGEAFDGGGA